MIGQTIIDGVDVYIEYGIGIAHNGLNELVAFNSLKTPDTNDWPEENGIEVDLSDPKLENKIFTIQFYGHRDRSVRDFIDFLDEQVYHTFEFPKLGITRILRFTKMNSRRTIDEYKIFDLEFSDDSYPFENYIRQDLIPINRYYNNKINIDNIPLSDYGFYHIYGTHDRLLVVGDVKSALNINEKTINSVIYDNGANIVYSSRDISIDLAFNAPSITFWNNWNAFFYDLTRPNERDLYYEERGENWKVFYKSCSVTRFECTGDELWCYFTITLTFSSMQINEMWNLLATDNFYGDIMLDNTYLMIDTSIKPDKNPS